jgi:hypothetical protein
MGRRTTGVQSAARKHTKQRLRERFGINVTVDELKEIEKNFIRKGYGHLGNRTNSRAVYEFMFDDIPVYFIYSKSKRCVVTVYTYQMVEKNFPELLGE